MGLLAIVVCLNMYAFKAGGSSVGNMCPQDDSHIYVQTGGQSRH